MISSVFTSVTPVIDSPNCYDSICEQQRFEKLQVYRYVEATPTKFRNGFATAAGFMGLAVVFSRFSISPFIWSLILEFCGASSHPCAGGLGRLLVLLIPLPNFVAPIALWLAVKAFQDLDQHPEDSGRIQAVLAVIIGCAGMILLAVDIAVFWRMSF